MPRPPRSPSPRHAALVAAGLLLALVPPSARGADAPPPAPDVQLLAYLNHAITWYRLQAAQGQAGTEPEEIVYSDSTRQAARDVIRLAFAFSRAAALLLPAPAASAPKTPARPGATFLDPDQLARMQADANAAQQSAKASVEALQRRLDAAPAKDHQLLALQLSEAKSELDLAEAREQTLKTFGDFVNQTGASGTTAGLLGDIDELQRSIPEAAPNQAGAAAPAHAGATPVPAKAAPAGILALATDILAQLHKMRQLRAGATLTTRLRAEVDSLRGPLLTDLKGTLQQGDQLSGAPDTSDVEVLLQRRRDLTALTAHFRKVSTALLPLGKQAVLLDSHKTTLDEWYDATDARYDVEARTLALHLGLLVVVIAVILSASQFWRRATFRYVKDARRRQQSLVVRRVVVAVAILLAVAFSLVSELGSLATFAGFITAGLAVALQNVILSVAAYFFLIGKYGIRVGDRVQIAGVTGDVIDIGLVRLHLMELRGDGLATGRVVVFSNAVLFQPSANFFKQIPGSNFSWHEVTVTLLPAADYRLAEARLMKAVDKVYATYREHISKQHASMLADMTLDVAEPAPHSQLLLKESGVDVIIRYPVPLADSARVDDQMTRALLDELGREPRLQVAGGQPVIAAVSEPVQPA